MAKNQIKIIFFAIPITMSRKIENIYDVNSYTDAELYDILDVFQPTDRELEARILFLIHKYENMQNKSGDELAVFFNKIYARFFQVDDEEEEEERPPELQNTIHYATEKEGFASMKDAMAAQLQEMDSKKPTTIPPTNPLQTVSSNSNNIGYVKTLDYSKDQLNPLLKQTIKRIVSIDSQYRENKQSMSTDFTFNLSDPLKDVVSIKLYSIQIPYTWYTISNNYGSNFFYIKGNAPGIDNGNHDYQVDISAGNYTPGNLVTAINAKIGQIAKQNTDISFATTNLSYNASTSLITTTMDITDTYNENYYNIQFPNKPYANDVSGIDPGPLRFKNIPAYLGFNNQTYYPYIIRSDYTVPFTNNGAKTNYEDTSIRKYYIDSSSDNKNNYITFIKYIGPGEYVDGTSIIDLSFQIHLTLTSDSTRNEIINDINSQLASCPYLTSDSHLSRLSITDPSATGYGNDYFQLVAKTNRSTTNNIAHSKLLVQFPAETVTSGYQPIWTGTTSCFQFQHLSNELNTFTSETSPIKQQSTNYFVKSNPYIYLRCITPGFNTPGYNTYGIDGLSTTLYPYLLDTSGNQISRNPDGTYVTGPDLSSNDYIFQIPNSTVIGYTLNDYLNAINSAISTENTKTKTPVIITGDFTMSYTNAQLDNTSTFQMNVDLTKTFNQSMYSVSLANSYLSTGFGLSNSYVDLSSQNQFHSAFDLLNSYTLSGDLLATIYPSPNGYGNRNSAPYIVSSGPINGVTYNSFQDLQTAVNNRFQNYIDPSDGTNVLTGTNISLKYNATTNKVDCSFTVLVNKHLTQNNYSIQFIDPSMLFYNDYYTATQSIDLNSIFNIDTNQSYYTDLSTCYNTNSALFSSTYTPISPTSTISLEGAIDASSVFTDMSAAFHFHDTFPRQLDPQATFVSHNYYTDLSTCYNSYANTLFQKYLPIADASATAPIFIIGASMQYYLRNPAPSSATYDTQNYAGYTVYLMDNSVNYYHDLANRNYLVDPSLVSTLDISTVYITDATAGNVVVTGSKIYMIDSSSVIYNDLSNSAAYLIDTSASYSLDNTTRNYWVNNIDVSAISNRSVYLVGSSNMSTTRTMTSPHIYRIDASTQYRIDSVPSTKTANTSSIYVLDHSANYYYNNTNYMVDPSLITRVGTLSKPAYFVSEGNVYKIAGSQTSYATYAVNSMSRVYNDISAVYLIDSSQNIFIDTSLNPTQYFIDPNTKIRITKPSSSTPARSVYMITSPTIDVSLNQRIGVVPPKAEIIRVDASSIYLVDTKLPYYLHPIYTSTSWYNDFKIDVSMIAQEYDLSLGYTTNTSYSTIKATKPVTSNSISIDKTNNTFTIVAEGEGVYSETGENNITVTIPVNTYTRTDLITAINKAIQTATNRDASGSFLQIYTDPVSLLEYTRFRANINRIYTAADYRLSFYDPYSFVKCFSGATSIKNTTWDTTLGWILGYRTNTVYALSDYGSRYKVITLTGDTGVSTNLYNYFLLCLDDYNQNHLNDGLVTLSSKDTNVSLPSYASRAQFQCDPATGKMTYNTLLNSTSDFSKLTQNQIYSVTEIANAKSQSATTTTTSGNTISSTSYGLGPFVQDVFGLIPMKVAGLANGSSYVDYGGTLQNQERVYFGPVNIQRMSVRLVSDKGDTIDLNGANWSFSLVVEQLYKNTSPSKNSGGGEKPSTS